MRIEFKYLLRSFVLFFPIVVKAQLVDFSVSPYHTTAMYKHVRDNYAYEKNLISHSELYHSSGIYIKAFEGSFISFLMDDKRLAVGEYLKFGAGIGRSYSGLFDQLEDDGRLFMYNAGLNGTTPIYSAGPIEKHKLGYQVDLNYGLQARYRLSKHNPDHTLGIRCFYILSLNPEIRPVTGMNLYGTLGVYYTGSKFSCLVEADWRQQPNQTGNRYYSFTGRKHTDKVKKTYLGLRVEHIRNSPPDDLFGKLGGKMRAYTAYFQLGRMII